MSVDFRVDGIYISCSRSTFGWSRCFNIRISLNVVHAALWSRNTFVIFFTATICSLSGSELIAREAEKTQPYAPWPIGSSRVYSLGNEIDTPFNHCTRADFPILPKENPSDELSCKTEILSNFRQWLKLMMRYWKNCVQVDMNYLSSGCECVRANQTIRRSNNGLMAWILYISI